VAELCGRSKASATATPLLVHRQIDLEIDSWFRLAGALPFDPEFATSQVQPHKYAASPDDHLPEGQFVSAHRVRDVPESRYCRGYFCRLQHHRCPEIVPEVEAERDR
jgi:hypothetical protein